MQERSCWCQWGWFNEQGTGLKDRGTLSSSNTKLISIFLGLSVSVVLLEQRIANKIKDLLKCSLHHLWEQVTAVSIVECRAGINTDTCLTGTSSSIHLRLSGLINFASNFSQNSYWIQCHSCICRNGWICMSLLLCSFETYTYISLENISLYSCIYNIYMYICPEFKLQLEQKWNAKCICQIL